LATTRIAIASPAAAPTAHAGATRVHVPGWPLQFVHGNSAGGAASAEGVRES
jgi:hypothetical protein